MEITLEKIELVKDRTGVSYKEAKEALEKAEGSVVDAIIAIEEAMEANISKKVGKQGASVIDSIKELIKKGNVAKIVVKKDGEIILNIPVNAGIVAVVVTPIATALAVAASFGFKCTIEIIKTDGTVVDVSERARDTKNTVVEKGAVILDDVKAKGGDLYEKAKDKVGEANIDELKEKGAAIYATGKEKAKDLAGHAKEKIQSRAGDDISLNIAEDLEKATDVINEGVSEELDDRIDIKDVDED